MIQGDSLQEFAQKIIYGKENKRDYIVPATALRMNTDETIQWESATGVVMTTPTDHARNQMADYLSIPRKFMEKLHTDAPDLISVNVNRLLDNHKGESRMVRTLGQSARALLSNRYRALDHEDIAEYILPVIMQNPDFRVASATVTEKRLYIQVVTPKLEGEVRVGDVVQGGFTVSNSEIGMGRMEIQPLLYRLQCKNGMMGLEYGKQKAHIGGRMLSDGEDFAVIQEETQIAMDKAFWLEMRDHLNAIASPEGFAKILGSLQESANDKVVGDPSKVVEEVTRRFSLRETESKSVLYSFLSGNDASRWGLANAVTEVANSHSSYDRAVELQGFGGALMGMTGHDWTSLASKGK